MQTEIVPPPPSYRRPVVQVPRHQAPPRIDQTVSLTAGWIFASTTLPTVRPVAP